jgi:FixJ family two-component response regulator
MTSPTPLIAVVDDDRSVVKSLARTLRAAGYNVGTFGSAQEFLSSLATSVPQCVVLDVQMPEMSGLELQDQLAAQGSCLPVIFMTAYDTPQTRAHVHRAGVFGLLLKPFPNEALLRAIREALSGQPQDFAAGTDHGESSPNGQA